MSGAPLTAVHLRPFGSYLLVRKISSGGMADVYRARVVGIRGFSKTVAIKRIYPHLLERSRFLRMFTDEAKIAALLLHPNIVQIHELGEEAGVPYIAMEYVRGRDLFDVARRLSDSGQRVPWRLAVRVVAELCRGLQHAHDFRHVDDLPQGIVHRDVSPRNILLGYGGEIKLTDFGVARARDREEHTEHGLIKGKVRYLSPEVARGVTADRRSDVFSLGVVLAEMLTMRAFREGPNDLAILAAIRQDELDPDCLTGAPPALVPVLEEALATDPDLRYSQASAFREDLLDAAGEDLAPMDDDETTWFMNQLFATEIEREKQEEIEVEQIISEIRVGDDGDAQEPAATAPGIFGENGPGAAFSGSRLKVRTPSPVPAQLAAAIAQPVEASPDQEGDLVRTSLVRVLHWLAADESTGRLELRRDPVRKSVFIEDGDPIFSVSNVETELFGEHLVSRSAISREEHTQALDYSASEGMRLTEALLMLEILPPHLLYRHLAEQVRERILEMFTWTTGRFAYYTGSTAPASAMPLGLRSYPLIHEGVHQSVPMAVIHRAFKGKRERTVERTGNDLPELLPLSGREQRILRTIDSTPGTIAELVKEVKDEEQVLRLLYLLQEIECLELV